MDIGGGISERVRVAYMCMTRTLSAVSYAIYRIKCQKTLSTYTQNLIRSTFGTGAYFESIGDSGRVSLIGCIF